METLDKTVLPERNKEQLLAEQQRLKAEMGYQLDGIKGDAADIGKKALLVGGGVYLTYKLARLATRSLRKHDNDFDSRGRKVILKKEKVAPTFGSLMKQQLMTIAVLIIASKIKTALKERNLLNE